MIKFVLQPIIENAVYHGLELKLGHGLLRITGGWINETEFSFAVYDSGISIEPELLKRINRQLEGLPPIDADEGGEVTQAPRKLTGIGLVNINQRIKSYYGEEYGLYVESEAGLWTRVNIRLKLLEEIPENSN